MQDVRSAGFHALPWSRCALPTVRIKMLHVLGIWAGAIWRITVALDLWRGRLGGQRGLNRASAAPRRLRPRIPFRPGGAASEGPEAGGHAVVRTHGPYWAWWVL